MIETWILSIATFLIGYYIGKGVTPMDVVAQVKKETYDKIKKDAGRVGTVRQPTAQEIYERTHPEGIKKAENDEAMRGLIKDTLINNTLS